MQVQDPISTSMAQAARGVAYSHLPRGYMFRPSRKKWLGKEKGGGVDRKIDGRNQKNKSTIA